MRSLYERTVREGICMGERIHRQICMRENWAGGDQPIPPSVCCGRLLIHPQQGRGRAQGSGSPPPPKPPNTNNNNTHANCWGLLRGRDLFPSISLAPAVDYSYTPCCIAFSCWLEKVKRHCDYGITVVLLLALPRSSPAPLSLTHSRPKPSQAPSPPSPTL